MHQLYSSRSQCSSFSHCEFNVLPLITWIVPTLHLYSFLLVPQSLTQVILYILYRVYAFAYCNYYVMVLIL